ncbi:hypothetical protein APY03_2454 [Variovorax sp. WDL1]|nr:hypothetical protein APY03_2454 [Variovorax sp. WDL1]
MPKVERRAVRHFYEDIHVSERLLGPVRRDDCSAPVGAHDGLHPAQHVGNKGVVLSGAEAPRMPDAI